MRRVSLVLNFLFQHFSIKSLKLKNRIVMPPMATNFATQNGQVTDRLINYYTARAKGGVGLIITEYAYISPNGKGLKNALGIYDDDLIPNLKKLVEAIHVNGAKIAIQLNHAGRLTSSEISGHPVVAPSAIRTSPYGEIPKELSLSEIELLKHSFGEAALRAKKAGFDAIEIHGANGYLINQFLSPYTNKRTDLYGGNLKNRMRFALEVIEQIKKSVGNDYPIIFRLCVDEFIKGGLNLEDAKLIAMELVKVGVDAIDISGGLRETAYMVTPPSAIPEGCYIEYATSIKNAINNKIPVIVAGRIRDPVMANHIIKDKKADLVAMGRALIADPELPNKAINGRLDEIRKCLACNEGCIGRLHQTDLSCAINYLVGHEGDVNLDNKATHKKNVVIIGGGPAGLETARVAAIRGHNVILYDKGEKLGGQMNVAAIPPFKEDINDLTNFLVKQLEELGVNVETKKEIKAEMLQEMNSDVVVIATGSTPIIPQFANICTNFCLAEDVLTNNLETGNNVVIVGGGSVGCETAEFLADKGKNVTIVEMQSDIALDVEARTRSFLLNRLDNKNIKVIVNATLKEFISGGAKINIQGKEETITDIDSIVLAVGYKSNNKLSKALKELNIEHLTIGDCVKPRNIMSAIHEGFLAAMEI